MGSVDDLYGACVEFLTACSDALVTSPGGAIGNAYVSPGPPPADCEQLTVHAGGPAEGDTLPLQPPLAAGHRTVVHGSVHLVNLTATVFRCVPVIDDEGTLPTGAELQAVARTTLGDVWAIWNHAMNQIRAGNLFSSPSGHREVFFDPAVALNVAGGLAGWAIGVRVQLGGYREA